MSRSIRYPLARLSPAKNELLVFRFEREHVESGNIAPVLEMLQPLIQSRTTAELFEGRLTFFFAGWDDDPRETAVILDIRRWFGELTAEFPYWLHFAEKEGDTLLHVLRLLCRGQYVGAKDGVATWEFDVKALTTVLETLFGYQNLLYDRLGLPEGMNMRISEEVAQLLESALSSSDLFRA